jgi:hypothetical protein
MSIFSAFFLWKSAPAKALRSAPWIGEQDEVSDHFFSYAVTSEQVEIETIGEKRRREKKGGGKRKEQRRK